MQLYDKHINVKGDYDDLKDAVVTWLNNQGGHMVWRGYTQTSAKERQVP